MRLPLTEDAIARLAHAIFAKPGARVVEAFSAFDTAALEFSNADDIVSYATPRALRKDGTAQIYVHYADMAGELRPRTIHLAPGARHLGALRYGWEGWGILQIHLRPGLGLHDKPQVSANSEKRALAWERTYVERLGAVSCWSWRAVAAHERRLKRVLSKSLSPELRAGK